MFPDCSASISIWLTKADHLLPDSESAKLDMEVLLAHCLSKSRTFLYTWPEHQLAESQYLKLIAFVEARQKGRPIAHLVGTREFWSLPLQVTADTLIPRPDTEVLIEWVLTQFDQTPKAVMDLGTGTGAIALALASEYPKWSVLGCDRISEAVTLANANAQCLDLGHVKFFESCWFDRFKEVVPQQRFDLIISNPPYIAEQDPHLSQGDVRFEPKSALTAGSDGLDDIRLIAKQSPNYLTCGGCLLIEHGYDQAVAVTEIFKRAGFVRIGSGQDYGGNDRFTFGWME